MTRLKTAVTALSMIAAVGMVGVAPRAEAVTVAPPAVCMGYGGVGTVAGDVDTIAFIVGEDGRVWYTKTTSAAAYIGLGTGAAGNPFAGAVPNVAASPLSGFVNPLTFPAGAGNFGIWVPVPGGVTFAQTTPVCINRPLTTAVGGAAPIPNAVVGNADNIVILVAGLDKRVWHTVFNGDADATFADANVLTSAPAFGVANVWTSATDAPGTVDGWASTIVGGASPIIPWVPFP